ncbi:MAG: carbohydrate-binding domain-containing protein [Lautropia sp.]|nr:carbohydrate-binding domain-containing protein [Lautropia sp.]
MADFPRQLILVSLTALGLAACGGGSDSSTSTTGGSDNISGTTTTTATGTTTTGTTSSASTKWNLSTGAYSPDLADTSAYLPLAIALDTMTVTSSSPRLTVVATSSTVTTVNLDGTAVITLTKDAYGVTIRSTLSGDTHVAYQLSGSGTTPITLYSDNDYKLLLSSATIASSDGPAINLQSKTTAFVELSGTSTLSDSSTWSSRTTDDGDSMDLKATFFAEGPLVFSGDGAMNINATPKHALVSDKHLRLKSGTLTLNAASKDGLRANNAFVMDGGTLSITTPAGKGIKVEGKEDSEQAIGFIAINDGTLTITSHDKAITASWKAEDDADTTDTSDDPDPRVTINGGTIEVTTTGTPYEDPTGEDSLSPEGIEAKSVLTINGGNITIDSTDDSLNAGTAIVIAGGRLYATSSANDAIDSNGTLTISGGYTVAVGSSVPEGAFDNDRNTFAITGGVLVGIGGTNSSPTTSATTQNSIAVGGNLTAGLWTLRDASGNAAFSFRLPIAAQSMVLSSPKLTSGTTYTVVTGGTLGTVSEDFNGLAVEPTTHTGGTTGDSLTITQTVSTLGNFMQGPGGGGMMPGGGVPPTGTPPMGMPPNFAW